ncbi:SMP-30/gluconolactonase/LRE family protein [Neiella sp. HB171785]|uniref:SMP-30/gluconolactonase/LRE family protein n=1 Tax=Neiella litorisoli TaxID=2771431 RepID=A0A8J6QTW4_9GAMM|nr:SMP-30/gluconolactonase/LRE family protein [Neiella litorisoli]MBD1388333.1 SMP-30/gluconolactonase/LRE family protein [Neiella litorisoli]
MTKLLPNAGLIALIAGLSLPSVDATEVEKATNLQPAKLFAELPANCPTPDAFAIAPNGSLTLSCPNFANNKLQGELLSLSPTGEVSHLATVPTLGLKKKANPMGIAYDEHGALYVGDSRGPKFGRILKLTFDGNDIVNTEVIASGINPNGLRYHQGQIYITQLQMPKVKSAKTTSAIYRFNASDRNLAMTNTLSDAQLIFHTETDNPAIKFGLDGLAFNKAGELFTADLGDSEVYRLTMDKDGKVTGKELLAKLPNDTRIDGIAFDADDNLYMAGFGLNQIFKLSPDGVVTLLADYADNDGSNGQIDQPADLIVYGNKLVISNFDLMKGKGIRNSKHSKPYTVSYIELN